METTQERTERQAAWRTEQVRRLAAIRTDHAALVEHIEEQWMAWYSASLTERTMTSGGVPKRKKRSDLRDAEIRAAVLMDVLTMTTNETEAQIRERLREQMTEQGMVTCWTPFEK